MSDLISREEALAYPLSYEHYDKQNGDIKFIHGVESYRDYIEGLPTVEQKHGHWDYYGYDEISNVHIYRCSKCECGNREATDYCPHCGAKMNEVTK